MSQGVATPIQSCRTISQCSLTRPDSCYSDVSDLLPQIDNNFNNLNNTLPDSVLLIQLAPSLFSESSKTSECKKSPSNNSCFEIKRIGRSPSEKNELNRNCQKNTSPSFVYRQLLRRAADSELSMIQFADSLLSDAMFSHAGLQRRLHKYKTNHRISPFANFEDLEYFLCERPHLYIFDSLGARRTLDRDRQIAIEFIRMISEFGFVGASKKELRYRLMNSSYPLKSIVVEQTLDEYLLQISPILEVIRLLNPAEEIVMLRGTYISEENLFVHHFKPGFFPTN